MMIIDLPDGCCYGDQNTWNIFPVSEQKITLNNRTLNNLMKQSKQNRNKSEFKIINRMNKCEYETTGKMTNNN
jgi:hypothetical protein